MLGRVRNMFARFLKKPAFRREAGVLAALMAVCVMAGAFVGIGLFSESLDQHDAEQHAAHYEDVRGAEAQKCGIGLLTIAQRNGCEEAVAETAREHERQEYELQAYRDAAVWTKTAAEVASIAGLIATMTVLLLYQTLGAQRRTIRETRRIGEAQTRAYLSIITCTAMFSDGKPSVKITLRNSGQSPALHVRWGGTVNLMPVGGDAIRIGRINPEYRKQTIDVPAAGERVSLYYDTRDIDLTNVELQAWLAGDRVAMATTIETWGEDVFGKRIEGRADFIHIFKSAPENLIPIEMTLGSALNPEPEAEDGQ